jgi:integrase
MTSFRNVKDQAKYVISKKLAFGTSRHTSKHNGNIHGFKSANNYTGNAKTLAEWLQFNDFTEGLHRITPELGIAYLKERAVYVSQSQLDGDRIALEHTLNMKLEVIKSERATILKSRAYTYEQVELISKAQRPHNSISTELCYIAGLRAHELAALRRLHESGESSRRKWSMNRFMGRSGICYTVKGKGGLIRAVLIPNILAKQLEDRRFAIPIDNHDRDVHYKKFYDIGSGHTWSQSFSAAAKRVLGWSNGGHGLRHSYAQNRMDELQGLGLIYNEALEIVSQELGHFRKEITLVYLR